MIMWLYTANMRNKVGEIMNYFTSEKINEFVTRILCPGSVYVYLVEGEQSALLIDTGCGVGSLKEYVESLTQLPYEVVLTHGHVDHAGGAGEFERVYLHEQDFAVAQEHMAVEMREDYLNHPSIAKSEFILPLAMEKLEALQDKQCFELGGVTVTMLGLAGHTPGSMCALVDECRSILLGDACNSLGFLQLPHSRSVSEYHQNLLAFAEYLNRFDHVWYSHPHNFGGKEIVEETIRLCEEIIAGKRVGIRQEKDKWGGMTFLAKEKDEHEHPLDGSISNFLYKSVF